MLSYKSNKKNNMKTIFQISLSILLIFFLIQVIPFNLSTLDNVSASSSWTVISDIDFNNGTCVNTTIMGNGASAKLKLEYCSWLKKNPINEPDGRMYHGMESIYGDDKVLIFGGVGSGYNYINDTWVYDYSENKWTQKAFGPNHGREFAMASVYETDKVVVFGGEYYDYKNETWIYDLSENKWTNKTSPGNEPSVRARHAMATIWGTKKILLFGGDSGITSTFINDTWVYDINDDKWTRKYPAKSPDPRSDHKMAPIFGTDKVLLFGGYRGTGWAVDDTWIYDLNDNLWTEIITSNQVGIRLQHAMTPIWGTDKVLLFGGNTGGEQISDTWIYDLSDNTWTEKKFGNHPYERCRHGMTFVNKTNKVILFGGSSWSSTYSNDTWEFENIDHGTFISNPYEIGPNASYKTINWNSDSTNETSIKLQLRTADYESEINLKTFIGPDGKTSSYYMTSGDTIFNGHKGDRWVQYRVYFNSTVEDEIPDLDAVTINYNYWPEKPILINPSNNDMLNNNIPIFTWVFKDVDSTHQSAFELHISNDKAFAHINYTCGVQLSTNHYWQFSTGINHTVLPDGNWYWRLRTKDSDGDWGPFSSPAKFIIDSKAPSSRITIPINHGFYKTLNTVSGEAFDTMGSGIQFVEIAIQRLNDYYYWNGTGWNSNEHWLPTQGKNLWTYNSSNITLVTDTQYNILSKAIDNINNHEISRFGNTFMIDNKSPSPISISINNNKEYTNSTSVNLSLFAEDSGSGIDQMAFSINGTLWNDWEPFNHEKALILPPNEGEKIVYFKVLDRAGNFAIVNDSIILDAQPPEYLKIIINDDTKYTNSRIIDLYLYANDSLSGIKDMAINTEKSMTISWEPFKETISIILPSGDGEKNVYFWVRDYAGNFAITNTTIILDTVPPHSLSIKINNGSSVTNSRTVYLTINALDDTSGVYQMSFSNEGITWSSWEEFRNNKSYVFPLGDGIITIYFKVRDYANNIADPESATILFNTTEPDNDKSKPSIFYSTIEYWLFLIIVIIIIFTLIVFQYIIKRKKHPKPEDKLPSVEVSTVKSGLNLGQEPIKEVRLSSPSYIQAIQTSEASTTVPSEPSIETSSETIIPKSTQIAQTTSSQQISQPTTLPQLPPAQQQNTSSETQESSVVPVQESPTQIQQSPTLVQPEIAKVNVNKKSQLSD